MNKKKSTDTNNIVEEQETSLNKKENEESNNLAEALKESNFNIKNLEDLYKQNLLLKQQIERDKMILKKARENFELDVKQKYKELDEYKRNMNSIIEKNKDEISYEYEQLTKKQEELDNDKKSYELLKKRQQANFKLKKEKQEALLETKKSELDSIELELKLKKEQIDSLRKKLEFDIKEFDSKKQELTNNLNRFNSLVATIGRGMDKIKEKNSK